MRFSLARCKICVAAWCVSLALSRTGIHGVTSGCVAGFNAFRGVNDYTLNDGTFSIRDSLNIVKRALELNTVSRY